MTALEHRWTGRRAMARWLCVFALLLVAGTTCASSSPARMTEVRVGVDAVGDAAIDAMPAVAPDRDTVLVPGPAGYKAPSFDAVLAFITVNGHYIVLHENRRSWSASSLIARMLRTPVDRLRIRVQFKESIDRDALVLRSTVGHVTLKQPNASAEALTIKFTPQEPPTEHAVAALVELQRALDHFQTLSSGLHALYVRLASPHVMEPLVVKLGDVEVPSSGRKPLEPLRFTDILDGSLVTKFLARCEIDPAFEATLDNRLQWGEILISVFSLVYCGAVQWLGPLDFTPWQQRCYTTSCISSACFQLVFMAWSLQVASIRTAFPLAMACGGIYFAAFNLTNVLILLEPAQASSENDQDETAGLMHLLRRRQPDQRRLFDSIPSSTQLHGMTRVVMVGYKKARFC